MISIIICSRNSNVNENIQKNINSTIGTAFEIVCIDNSKGEYSMCSAYNEGVRRAKGEYLCFMHEDIIFLSNGWGNICIEQFKDECVWMLGVVGTTYLDAGSRYWCFSGKDVGHAWTNGRKYVFNNDSASQDVVAIDGFWMMIRRELFENALKWDSSIFQKFDMYDMDMSIQVISNGGRIRIIEEIDINHLSAGNYTPTFYEELLKFHAKWDHVLPVATFPLSQESINKIQHTLLLGQISEQNNLYYINSSKLYKTLMMIFSFVQTLKKFIHR